MVDDERVQELKDRLADRYTAAEICDLINVSVEDIIEEHWEQILSLGSLFPEIGLDQDEEELYEG